MLDRRIYTFKRENVDKEWRPLFHTCTIFALSSTLPTIHITPFSDTCLIETIVPLRIDFPISSPSPRLATNGHHYRQIKIAICQDKRRRRTNGRGIDIGTVIRYDPGADDKM